MFFFLQYFCIKLANPRSVMICGRLIFPWLSVINNVLIFIKGIWIVLPLLTCVYRAVDGFLLPASGGHRCQFTGVLHHSLHRGSLCFTHLHHFHLRSSGETSAPGRDVSLQHAQRPQQAHPVLVSTHAETLIHPFNE